MSIESAKEELSWLKKTATDEKDRCRVIGYEDCLRLWEKTEQPVDCRPHPNTSFEVRIKNALHGLNLGRNDIKDLPDGHGIVRNIANDRIIAALLEDLQSHLKRESGEVLAMLKQYRVAASRMCDRWAEGDQAVKNELWKALHGLESDALEVIERAEKGQS